MKLYENYRTPALCINTYSRNTAPLKITIRNRPGNDTGLTRPSLAPAQHGNREPRPACAFHAVDEHSVKYGV
jgi:hypothetical protein